MSSTGELQPVMRPAPGIRRLHLRTTVTPSVRWLLLLYSLSPGIAKLVGVDALFGVGLLLLIAYFASMNAEVDQLTDVRAFRYLMPRLPLLFFVLYGGLLGIGLCIVGTADTRVAVVGTFNFLVPMLIVVAAGPARAARLLHDLPFVAVVHALLALLMFAPLRPPISFIESLSETLLTGTAAFRLSSVSGSLALSTTMVAAFAVALHRHVLRRPGADRASLMWPAAALFLLCGFLSLQRAAWLSLALIWAAGVVSAGSGRRLGVIGLVTVVVLPIVGALLFLDIPQDAIEIFLDRFSTLTGGGEVGAVAERSGQWLNVSYNLLLLPIGHGPGQLGQPVRDMGPFTGGLPIFDGDYFRIISEYGAVGAALLILLAIGGWRALRSVMRRRSAGHHRQSIVLAAAVLGLLLQCVGTNVTELYFANVVFWSLWLQSWVTPKPAVAESRASRAAPSC